MGGGRPPVLPPNLGSRTRANSHSEQRRESGGKQTKPNPPNVVVKKVFLHPFCHERRGDSCFQRIEGGTFWMGAQATRTDS